MEKIEIVNTVKFERQKRHITQKGMAQDLGISKSALYQIEKGIILPGTRIGLLISDYFEMTVNELFKIVKDG